MRVAMLSIAVLAVFDVAVAFASVPPMINYQGKLMQPSGAPVPDGTYSMTFAIYDVPTGGTPLWSETNPSVQVKGGLFAVLLGSINNLPANIFDNPNRWFGVKVGDDPEMTPRQQIASTGFAFRAATAGTVDDGAITAAKLAPGVAIPPGTIVMWSGSVANIPQGWALCDGTNGTPDLRDRFIVGAGGGYAVGATGGEAFHTLTVAEMPAHSHSVDYANASGPFYWDKGVGAWQNTGNTGSTGGNQPHENRPPYYALCYIMKVPY